MVKNGTITYIAQPAPGTESIEPEQYLKYHEEDIDLENVPLKGGFLIKTLYLSSDPYILYRMRDPKSSSAMFCPALEVGKPIDNFGIGVVVRSEDPKFPAGSYVNGYLDFQQYSIWPSPNQHFLKSIMKVEKNPKIPLTTYIGALGLPGQSAFSAFDVFAKEKTRTSKTLFVSSGASPVGTFVTQYAKIINPNIKVIASTSSAEKIELLKEAGVDVPFNYRETDTAKILQEHGPIDIYWDNVAGSTLDAALLNMNSCGLIIACGAITSARKGGAGSAVNHFEEIFQRSLTVHGFTCGSGKSAEVLPQFYDVVTPLVAEGKIKGREYRYSGGLKDTARALKDHHRSVNVGKSIIVIADE